RADIAAADWPHAQGLAKKTYGVVTMHRPSNVDDPARLAALVEVFESIAARTALVLPLHPRTRQRLETGGLLDRLSPVPRLKLLPPLGYVEFMSAVTSARFVLTDSGGIQEETTYLGIPCLTLRDNTERPVTVTDGSNRLVKLETLAHDVDGVLSGPRRIG